MAARNLEKSGLLYHAIDASAGFYRSPIEVTFRSKMNVTFHLRDASLNDTFVSEANKNGLVNLKGHRSAGGMRASIYNAMPIEGVKALVHFMQDFARQHG